MAGLYRYQSKRYNDGLLEKGNLRIGTLYDFRKSEHKPGIADSFEGKKIVSHELGAFSSDVYNPVGRKALKDFGFADVEGVSNFSMGSGFTLERVIESSDCFIFCMSSVLSDSMFQEFGGAETCVSIENARSFFWRLTYSIDQIIPVEFRGLHNVVYTDEAESWNLGDWGTAPAYKKTTEYSAQHEVRAIWIPKLASPIEPLLINDKKLRRYVRQCI